MHFFTPWTNHIAGIILGLLVSHYSTTFLSVDIITSKNATTMASPLKVGDNFPEGVEFSYALSKFKKASSKRLPIAAYKYTSVATSHTAKRRRISTPVEPPQLTMPARSLRIKKSYYSPSQVGHYVLPWMRTKSGVTS